jgi:hypothetical protein
MRPTLKSTAAAVFIGGCAAAGIAVASASTPAAHHTPSTSQIQPADSAATTGLEAQHHGRDAHQDLHRGRDAHQNLNRGPSDQQGSGADDETLPPTVVPSTEPGDDDQSTEPVETHSVEPGDDDSQSSSEPGDDDSASQEPGDDNGTDVPGDEDGATGASGGDSFSG